MTKRTSLILLSGTVAVFALAGCPGPGPGPVPTPIPIPITGDGHFTVGLNPTAALPGAQVLFGIGNASASLPGDIMWEGARVATFSVGVDGTANGTFDVPARSTAATHSLTIEVGGVQANASFDVNLAGSVSPGSGRPGTVLDISASNAVPSEGYTAYWDGQSIGSKTADGTERVDFGFTVPDTTTSGAHTVRVVGAGHEADLTYTVPDLSITAPGTTRFGDTFAVASSGEIPGHTYQVFWDGALNGSAVADSNGGTTFTVRVPIDANVGNHTVKVADETGTGLSGAVTVNIPDTAVLAGPTSTNESQQTWYQGSGWAPNEVVTVTDGWQTIGTATTDYSGNFSLWIDFYTSGYHFVTANGSRGDSANLDVDVIAPYVPPPPPVDPGCCNPGPVPPPVDPGCCDPGPVPPPVDPGSGGRPVPPPVDPGSGGSRPVPPPVAYSVGTATPSVSLTHAPDKSSLTPPSSN